MSAREIAALLFRELGLVLLVLAVPVLLAIGLFVVTPRNYLADAKVLVAAARSGQAGGEIGTPQLTAPQVTAVEVLNSEVEILKNRELAQRTAEAVGAHNLFPNLPLQRETGKPRPEQVEAAFAKALDVRAVKDANVIDVDFKAPTPALAQEALAKYLGFYLELHGEAYARPVAAFLNTQLNGYETRLREVEAKIAAFTEANRLFDPDQERRNLLDTRSNLSASVIQLRTHAAELGSRVGSLQSLQSKTPVQQQDYSETEQSEAVERARGQLLDLQVQRTKLAQNYQPGARQLKDVQAQIDAVNGFLGGEGRKFSGRVRTGRNPLYDELQAETARARAQVGPEEARAAAVERSIADIDTRLSQISEGQKTLDPLQRERRQLAATLDTFRQRQAEASLLENLDKRGVANVRVIQPARAVSVDKPFAPKLSTFLAGGLAAGVLLAGVVLALLFALKNTFIGPESVEARTKIPVLVSLPGALGLDGLVAGAEPGGGSARVGLRRTPGSIQGSGDCEADSTAPDGPLRIRAASGSVSVAIEGRRGSNRGRGAAGVFSGAKASKSALRSGRTTAASSPPPLRRNRRASSRSEGVTAGAAACAQAAVAHRSQTVAAILMRRS